ncbi:hypothetical protein [Methylocystis echinoides]|uniref:hypothetical protein n=1 Tax=Methylocystis echinoides TaxID=29468 RepID=UPI00342D64DD
MARIEIVPVSGLSQFLAFCRLPRLLYKGAPGFAPPLDVERWTLFAHFLNPHYKLVEDQKFLARRDGEWVGRISAHVYKTGITPVGASPAQFGALDAIDDPEVVRALTEAAEAWLKAKGATRINGPFSPTINGECGLLVEGFEATPMIFMPWHPPYLSRHLEALGYGKAKDLLSYRFAIEETLLNEKPRITSRKEWRDRLTLRPLDKSKLKTGETALMEELFNDGWSGNWGFVPFTKAEFDSTADALNLVMPPEFGIVAELDGKPQSFVIALPNLFEIVADFDGRLLPFGLPKLISRMRNHKFNAARIVLLGTRKALQNSATGGAILLGMIEEMRRRGASASIKHLEAGWVLEDNMAMRRPIEMFGGKVDKVHRIYEKQFGASP